MSKKRKKLRKALKALGAGLAIAGLGRAFMNRNRTGTEFPRPKSRNYRSDGKRHDCCKHQKFMMILS